MDFIKNLLPPMPTIKFPKMKRLRQWQSGSLDRTYDSTLAVSEPGRRNSHKITSVNKIQYISTISSVHMVSTMDRPMDSGPIGLAALKRDRAYERQVAKRNGILLNVPMHHHFFASEMVHEKFSPCKKRYDTSNAPESLPPYEHREFIQIDFNRVTQIDQKHFKDLEKSLENAKNRNLEIVKTWPAVENQQQPVVPPPRRKRKLRPPPPPPVSRLETPQDSLQLDSITPQKYPRRRKGSQTSGDSLQSSLHLSFDTKKSTDLKRLQFMRSIVSTPDSMKSLESIPAENNPKKVHKMRHSRSEDSLDSLDHPTRRRKSLAPAPPVPMEKSESMGDVTATSVSPLRKDGFEKYMKNFRPVYNHQSVDDISKPTSKISQNKYLNKNIVTDPRKVEETRQIGFKYQQNSKNLTEKRSLDAKNKIEKVLTCPFIDPAVLEEKISFEEARFNSIISRKYAPEISSITGTDEYSQPVIKDEKFEESKMKRQMGWKKDPLFSSSSLESIAENTPKQSRSNSIDIFQQGKGKGDLFDEFDDIFTSSVDGGSQANSTDFSDLNRGDEFKKKAPRKKVVEKCNDSSTTNTEQILNRIAVNGSSFGNDQHDNIKTATVVTISDETMNQVLTNFDTISVGSPHSSSKTLCEPIETIHQSSVLPQIVAKWSQSVQFAQSISTSTHTTPSNDSTILPHRKKIVLNDEEVNKSSKTLRAIHPSTPSALEPKVTVVVPTVTRKTPSVKSKFENTDCRSILNQEIKQFYENRQKLLKKVDAPSNATTTQQEVVVPVIGKINKKHGPPIILINDQKCLVDINNSNDIANSNLNNNTPKTNNKCDAVGDCRKRIIGDINNEKQVKMENSNISDCYYFHKTAPRQKSSSQVFDSKHYFDGNNGNNEVNFIRNEEGSQSKFSMETVEVELTL